MINFNQLSIIKKIQNWDKIQTKQLKICGVNLGQWAFLFKDWLNDQLNRSQAAFIFVPNSDYADQIYHLLSPHMDCVIFEGFESSPFSGVIQQSSALSSRISTLFRLNTKTLCVISTIEAASLKCPPKDFFTTTSFSLDIDQIIARQDLINKLIELGLVAAPSCDEPGTFCFKGEIFDIYPLNHPPVRIHFFDDLVETIYQIDPVTQISIKEQVIKKIEISPAFHLLTNKDYALNLRENLPRLQPSQKELIRQRDQIFQKLQDGHLFESFSNLFPLFFNSNSTLLDFISKNDHVIIFEPEKCFDFISQYQIELREDYQRVVQNQTQLVAETHQIYDFKQLDYFRQHYPYQSVHELDVLADLAVNLDNKINIHLVDNSVFLNSLLTPNDFELPKLEQIKKIIAQLAILQKNGLKIILCQLKGHNIDRILHLMNEYGLIARYEILETSLAKGFLYKTENILLLTEADFFTEKIRKTKATKSINLDLFAEQLSTLTAGDYVIHKDFGVGKYNGLKEINIGQSRNDFLEIVFKDEDKVFVPVYKLDLIQKYADNDQSLTLADLKSKKFEQQKAKAKNSAKKLAFDLLELYAQRKLAKSYAFSVPDQLFHDFEREFPFQETTDQLAAINDVLEDMQKDSPMDRLVCGDVGFGKTEVAMRAAFKAVEDKKQVVVLVPTTVLAFQHFHSFKKRFDKFPITIDYLSRFKSPKEEAQTLKDIEEGKVDIIIGTHKLFSDKVKYHDLGLVVIDEEHRFGVGHKEKLKHLRHGVDVLTMTATPIPRTLQLSFLGIRDFSLIKTAPPRRKSIKTFIIKDDASTIKDAIERELNRGGQVFYVHNRVHDIEKVAAAISKLVPTAKIAIGHGQLAERELEKTITAFYRGDYDILLATTIIESGIDIPNANTIIIDRADTYGLAQLHQLRGRIGRSDKKAYAYFVIPNDRNLNEIATKRLQALQKYADTGSGFSIASSDLEIRGAGDILGAEQSGHISTIGLELYMELLQSAISEIQGKKVFETRTVEIQTPFSCYIPNNYIQDSGNRLKYYKKLSNSKNVDQIDHTMSEIENIFGVIPIALSNLKQVILSKIFLSSLPLKSIKVGGQQIVLNFDKTLFEGNPELQSKVAQYFLSKPKHFKINPDFSVVHLSKESITPDYLTQFSKNISHDLVAT
jgi:transcription-repair coupling factor (superfamily II helicase)